MTPDEDDLAIPAFLRRGPNNEVPDVPAPVTAAVTPEKQQARESEAVYARCDAATDEFEQRKKQKARGRIGKMLAKKADKTALREGKTWDPIKAKWV